MFKLCPSDNFGLKFSFSYVLHFLIKMSSDEEAAETRLLVAQQNRKKKKSGGFQSMGLSQPVFKGVLHKGYKVPTPIQRKTIPVILEGRDTVGMARTGSGKSAAFLIPMFQRLLRHSSRTGTRALVLSPTRELALQTLKFTREIGKYTGLRAAVVLGGDSLEEQFAALHQKPDIIIGTPGRLLHLLMEMDLKLSAAEYVVFDEADRLFEMGFAEQLHEIVARLPVDRQTIMFSATLPKQLVEFARAGLTDPVLIRLDVDTKLSENLSVSFLSCRSVDKPALLLHLVRERAAASQQTVVFAATKHHVEYLQAVLEAAELPCSCIYSSLDPTARKIAAAKFSARQTFILLVTDVAARGIDIPLLDHVVNWHFPAKPKLFLHRVGRVARAGRSGSTVSLVSPDEVAHLIDLHLFLNRPVTLADSSTTTETGYVYGSVPRSVTDKEEDSLRLWTAQSPDIRGLEKTSENSYGKYLRSREAASHESVKRAKELALTPPHVHPVFRGVEGGQEDERSQLLDKLRSYKANTTIFEINATRKTKAFEVMKAQREIQRDAIEKTRTSREVRMKQRQEAAAAGAGEGAAGEEGSSQVDIDSAFSTVITAGKSLESTGEKKRGEKKKKSGPTRDEENFINYRPSDYASERGYSVGGASSSFEAAAAGAVLDLTQDDGNTKTKQRTTWDRKRKRFVKSDESSRGEKKIKTESGQWVPASYKKNMYERWLKRGKQQDEERGSGGEEDEARRAGPSRGSGRGVEVLGGGRNRGKGFHKQAPKKDAKSELRDKDLILKTRTVKNRKINFMKKRRAINSSKRGGKGGGGGGGKKGGGSSKAGKKSRGKNH